MPKVGRAATGEHKQSVVFNKATAWTQASSRKWCKEHKYYTDGYEPTENTHRWRQYDPDDKKFRYRNQTIEEKGESWSIFLVLGYPLGKRAAKTEPTGTKGRKTPPAAAVMACFGAELARGWAIDSRVLDGLLQAAVHVDLSSLQISLEHAPLQYHRAHETGIIPIKGIITDEPTLLGALLGSEVTHEQIREAIELATEDVEAKRIVLSFNSPGGPADGMQAVADVVAEANQRKPIYAYTDSQMLSGAYFLGSQGRQVLTSPEGCVGNIGSLVVVDDWSKAFEQKGVKAHVVSSAPLKGIGVLGTELNTEQREHLQEFVDDIAAVFKQVVARGRGFTAKRIDELADGRVFVGERAVTAGLADHVITLDKWLLEQGTEN